MNINDNNVSFSVRARVINQLGSKVYPIVRQVSYRVHHQVRVQVENQVWDNFVIPVGNQLIEKYEYS